MAEDESADQPTKSPGLGMRMSISMINKKFPTVQHISTEELSSSLKTMEQGKELLILDCRPEEEFVVSHIQGAVRVDYESDANDILKKISKSQDTSNTDTIVCYCSAGYRSSMVAEKLQKYHKHTGNKSWNKVYNLEGSLFKWANESRPMVDNDNKPTPFAHPYNPVFGKLLDGQLRRNKPYL